ncbi:MAG TPA: hypothetical protein PLG15_06185 [Candidatus Gastranaerophilaceae bacterium]|nr:hypothetical protein [Candidatus Gastranaerophilaceae bacterium]HPT41954.1 hypothetical protein [Candidatus Gastranaerophilaceae bacterium]
MTASIGTFAPYYPQSGICNNGNLSGDDIFYGNDDFLSSSIFNNNGFNTLNNLGGGCFGPTILQNSYGYPGQMPMMQEGETLEEYAKRVKDYVGLQGEIQNDMQKSQLNNQVEYQKRMNGVNFDLTSEEDAITRQIAILQSKIKANEQDQIMSCYNKLLQSAKQQLAAQGIDVSKISNDQLKAYVEKLYNQATGKSMTDEIAENGTGQFWSGFGKGFFGLGTLFGNSRTAQDNISDITGEPLSKSQMTSKAVGGSLGVVAAGAICVGAGVLCPPLGIALGVALGAGIISLFSKKKKA